MSDFVKTSRTRNYVSILYPESAREDWARILAEACVPAIVSPLHDKDINPDNTPKKPHYHVMLMFQGVKSQAQAQAVFDSIGAVHCQSVSSVQGQARYFLHMDNPEKYQYPADEVKCFSGADFYELTKTSGDRYKTISEIMTYLEAHPNIDSYANFIQFCRKNNNVWFKILCDNTVLFKGYFSSYTWTLNKDLDNGNRSYRLPEE